MAPPKQFQATVEEDEACCPMTPTTTAAAMTDNANINTTAAITNGTTSTSTSTNTSSIPHANANSSGGGGSTSTSNNAIMTPPSSRESSPKHRAVHFSTRHPVVLHHRTSSHTYSHANAHPDPHASWADAQPPVAASPQPLSVVDEQWGRLFTEKGQPTLRLAEVLRGVAKQMIRDEEGSLTLVLSPDAILRLYERYKLDQEFYPFTAIFDCQSRHGLRNLEMLYQDLACEYHLVQEHARTRPCIPALTPSGLATWMTAFVRASPGHESRRLSAMLLDMPLEADCVPPERLPKQLSRHLLPAHPVDDAAALVAASLADWARRGAGESRTTTPAENVYLPAASSAASSASSSCYSASSYFPPTLHQSHSYTAARPKLVSCRDRRSSYATRPTPPPPPPPVPVHHHHHHGHHGRHGHRSHHLGYAHHHHHQPPPPAPPPSASAYLARPEYRSSRDSSPQRRHGSRRARDRSPKSQRAQSRDKRCAAAAASAVVVERRRSREVSPPETPPSPARAESYRFFQGRGSAGPRWTYDECRRDRKRFAV